MSLFSTPSVNKAIGDPRLKLVKGEGYWYFIFDDVAENNVFETHSIYVMRLNEMPLARWVEEGKAFLEKMKQRIEEQKGSK